jgi:hypothetical protein
MRTLPKQAPLTNLVVLAVLFYCLVPVNAFAQGYSQEQYQSFEKMIIRTAYITCNSKYTTKKGISLETKYDLLKLLGRKHPSYSFDTRNDIINLILMKAYQDCPRLFVEDPANWKDR